LLRIGEAPLKAELAPVYVGNGIAPEAELEVTPGADDVRIIPAGDRKAVGLRGGMIKLY